MSPTSRRQFTSVADQRARAAGGTGQRIPRGRPRGRGDRHSHAGRAPDGLGPADRGPVRADREIVAPLELRRGRSSSVEKRGGASGAASARSCAAASHTPRTSARSTQPVAPRGCQRGAPTDAPPANGAGLLPQGRRRFAMASRRTGHRPVAGSTLRRTTRAWRRSPRPRTQQDPLRLGAVDPRVPDHDLQAQAVLERDQPAGDRLGRRRRARRLPRGDPGLEHRLVEQTWRSKNDALRTAKAGLDAGEGVELVEQPALLVVRARSGRRAGSRGAAARRGSSSSRTAAARRSA